jgi:RNA polymerase sigma factor (sigma-70 family)
MQHQGLVRSVAQKYRNLCTASTDFDDLVQAGNIGLLKAIEDYDDSRGAFSTYAFHWIRDAIQCELYSNSRTVRIPRHVLRVKGSPKDSVELDTDEMEDEHDFTVMVDIQSMYKNVRKEMLDKLDPVQQKVLYLRFTKGMTRPEIGVELQCSREWVRVIELKALDILRNALANLGNTFQDGN